MGSEPSLPKKNPPPCNQAQFNVGCGIAVASVYMLSSPNEGGKIKHMHAIAVGDSLLGYFNLGGGEIILILALVLILFGAKKLPDLAQGLGRGIDRFRDAVDDEAREAGRSAGGIYGKSATQALTPDNQVAELYDPGVCSREKRPRRRRRLTAWLSRLRRAVMAWWNQGA